MSEVSEMINKQFGEADDRRDACVKDSDKISYDRDIAYGDDYEQVLDVYRPLECTGKLPVIISVHGGGWVYGDKNRYSFYCQHLAERGFAVVNYTYRLAPRCKFPASLEDTNTVFHWTLDNSDVYDFDMDHVFAVGDSAGAHLLGLYMNLCTNKAYASQFSFTPVSYLPKAIALNCGAYEITMEDPEDMTSMLMKDFLPNEGTQEELVQINVLKYLTKDFPPTFLMTCNNDFLQAQAAPMAEVLRKNNVPFIYRFYGGEKTLGHVFMLNMKTEESRKCNDHECMFFREFMEE